jgi:hypothetical protein
LCEKISTERYMMRRAVLLAATCLTYAAAARAEQKFDFDHTPGRLPKTVVPDSYQIDLVPDLQKLTLAGHETVVVNVRQAENDVALEDIGLAISHAALEDGSIATVSLDAANQTATLHFPHAVSAGKHTLTLDYTGTIPNTPAGIYYNDYKTAAGAAKRMLVTQFENTDARRMFPGWDEPVFKAKFRLSAVLPTDYVAISNMPIVSTAPAGPGLHKVQFDTSPRMSTYLLALIAGDLEAVRATADGTKLGAWAPRGEANQAEYSLEVELSVAEAGPDCHSRQFRGGCDGELGRHHLHRRHHAVQSENLRRAHAGDDPYRCGARNGTSMVGRPGDDGVVERYLAERGLRHLDGVQGDRSFQSVMADLAAPA